MAKDGWLKVCLPDAMPDNNDDDDNADDDNDNDAAEYFVYFKIFHIIKY